MQAYVFVFLTSLYIKEAIEEEDEEEGGKKKKRLKHKVAAIATDKEKVA